MAAPATGPLRIHPTNPRYFTDGSGKAIYLTGSHTWGNLSDSQDHPAFDYRAYLDFLDQYKHNFIRLWSGYNLGRAPIPYERSGPAAAADGQPKVDLTRLDPHFFERLRSRVIAAGDRDIYVAIMLFAPDGAKKEDWPILFFNPANNVQSIDADTNTDGSGAEAYDLSIPRITAFEEAFARKVIDSVNDLDNVLYEIGNEGDVSSIPWQYHFIRFIKKYEAHKPKQHPVGMTAVFNILNGSWTADNRALLDSAADWISPGSDPYKDNPPASDGRKVIVADVDHIWPTAPHRGWIWECFLRGIHPILMDWYTYGNPKWTSLAEQEAMRKYMGYSQKYARKMDLAALSPRNDLTSTAYCLANVGAEYLVYQPASESAFTVEMPAGTYNYEWFNPGAAVVAAQGSVTAPGGRHSFTAPFIGEALLYLVNGATPQNEARSAFATKSAPIHLHPENPHYFLWRGKPTVLITAGEHYGAVLNLDFEYVRYLDELKTHRFNLTRVFSGTYREVAGSFNITGNTIAPSAGRFTCPWARSETAGASDGGNKFDLMKWDGAYFSRLKDFITQAGQRGVVVELVFFCTMYDDKVWEASAMNARNNVNGVGAVGREEVYDAGDKELFAVQKAVVRKIVAELNNCDNLYYEVCNEPYERGGLTKEWNDQILGTIVETEAVLPKKHLIAQGFPPSDSPIADLNPHVSVLNFHAATAEVVRLNYRFNKVIAFDETGGSDRTDGKYRTEGWNFILAGGGVYDHLDFSFTPDHEDGMAVPLPTGTPGGGGPQLRRQLQVLKEFIEGFDFIRMVPNDGVIKSRQIAAPPAGNSPTKTGPTVRALAEVGKAYAIYFNGGTQAAQAELVLEFPAGGYRVEWVNTKTGRAESAETFDHAGGNRSLISPSYAEDIALRVMRKSDSKVGEP